MEIAAVEKGNQLRAVTSAPMDPSATLAEQVVKFVDQYIPGAFGTIFPRQEEE